MTRIYLTRIYCFRCHKIRNHILVGDDYQCSECGSSRSSLFKLQPKFRDHMEAQWKLLEELDQSVEEVKRFYAEQSVESALPYLPWEKGGEMIEKEFVLAYVDFLPGVTWSEAIDEAYRLDELAAEEMIRDFTE